MSDTRYMLVTGLSGSGKSLVQACLEDLGFDCVDNLPISLIGKFFELIESSRDVRRAAVVTDVRERAFLTDFVRTYVDLKAQLNLELLFLEASESVLIRRFSETRRRHPLTGDGSLVQALALEREKLRPVRDLADYVIDTSTFTVHEVREQIRRMFSAEDGIHSLTVTVESFGFKHGTPREADLMFDVRFLPNPYFDPELRERTGLEQPVVEFVGGNPETHEFLELLSGLLHYLLPRYEAEGKSYLTIAIGCTGGRHRSVVIAHEVATALSDLKYPIHVRHRDVGRS